MSALAVTLGLLLGVAGCQSSTALDDITSVGVIEVLASGEEPIVVPDIARVGVPFEVSVTTTGLNGCVREGDTDVTRWTSSAVITPRDVTTYRSDRGCHQAIQYFTRTVTITFDEPGAATVAVLGRSFGDSEIHRHEFQVTVEE